MTSGHVVAFPRPSPGYSLARGGKLPPMQFFRRLGEMNTSEALAEVLVHGGPFWDRYGLRKGPGSPHRECPDLWLRYRDPSELDRAHEPHWPVWYEAARLLPSCRKLCAVLQSAANAEHLGGVLVTKIPPGCQVYPHQDTGRWHAEWYNVKVYVVLQGPVGCVNVVGEPHANAPEQVEMRTGEAWAFENRVLHSVRNDGEQDRISLIVCMRTEW